MTESTQTDLSSIILYDNKTIADLIREIHEDKKSINQTIDATVEIMQPMIKNINDVLIVSPVLKDYLDINVKNNESLIKLISVVQKLITNKSGQTESDGILSDSEIEALKRTFDMNDRIEEKHEEKKSSLPKGMTIG